MKIQVLGSGCQSCKQLYELTKSAAEELKLQEEVEYVTDIQKIIEMGVMRTPVLAINGEPVLVGSVPDRARIKEILKTHS